MQIPETMTFEEAIAYTEQILVAMETGSLAADDLETVLTRLVSTENGARGFFVTYLTDDRPLSDVPSEAVLNALAASPQVVSELLVKNLAMAAAMAVTHRFNQQELMAQRSDRVRSRTQGLIQRLHLPQVSEKLQQLNESATTGQGTYQAFLDRWGYDVEQRQVIQQVTQTALEA